ncbi:branched-chain amino acid ABC transporter permease [Deferrisoma palaeochoriense]
MARSGTGARFVALAPRIGTAGLLAALVVVPPHLGYFNQIFLSEILVWALFAMSFDLVYGYTGLLSFGQSLFFGAGGYAVALGVSRLDLSALPCLGLAVLVGALLALLVGFVAVRVSGIHFVLITIIFALIGYLVAQRWVWLTGGDDGMTCACPLLVLGGWEISIAKPIRGYYFTLGVVCVAALGLVRLVSSPFGWVLRGIRENETRMGLLGYDEKLCKLFAFVVAGATAGLAGGLFAILSRFANPAFLHWTTSGKAVVWTIVGGPGSLAGPALGTALLMAIEHAARRVMEGSELLVGAILILSVILAPQGIVGAWRKWSRTRERA